MPDTLYLDPVAWDLALDASGNIALASEPYSLAQDAACAIRTFLGECYYSTKLGIPYFQKILGHLPALQYVKSQMISAALTVPGVVSAQVFITGFVNRNLVGQVQITDAAGAVTAANFGTTSIIGIPSSDPVPPEGFHFLTDEDGIPIVTSDGDFVICA